MCAANIFEETRVKNVPTEKNIMQKKKQGENNKHTDSRTEQTLNKVNPKNSC